ncbi:hypothetical protein, partial [Alteromonas stellipolaris]|uniref:hypothetical protein n=1 Tax=Alteromonas stellipolaris TaxID=233316 RepID=UPI001D6ED68C
LDNIENALLPLPCLVTLICKSLTPEEEWEQVSRYKVFVKKVKTSSAYNSCERKFLTPTTNTEDVPVESEESESQPMDLGEDEDPFWH